MDELIEQFWHAGLIQFGRFGDIPFKLQFELLPSYPDIWSNLLQRLIQLVDITRYERFLAPSDSVPLGTMLSYRTNIPLVYSKGTGREGVYDLLGAYDIGHPTLLVANVWANAEPSYAPLIHKAGRVGLELRAALVIMTYGEPHSPDVTIHRLFRLEDVITMLCDARKLPTGQVEAVLKWVAQR